MHENKAKNKPNALSDTVTENYSILLFNLMILFSKAEEVHIIQVNLEMTGAQIDAACIDVNF